MARRKKGRSKAAAKLTKQAEKRNSAKCPWFLYVAECADRTLYVGIAKNVEARIACHNSGRGAKYTRTRGPVRMVYSEKLPDVGSALRREREVKRWSRPKKVAELALASPPRLTPRRTRGARRRAA